MLTAYGMLAWRLTDVRGNVEAIAPIETVLYTDGTAVGGDGSNPRPGRSI